MNLNLAQYLLPEGILEYFDIILEYIILDNSEHVKLCDSENVIILDKKFTPGKMDEDMCMWNVDLVILDGLTSNGYVEISNIQDMSDNRISANSKVSFTAV